MTPILYEATETSFNTNGLGMLSDATSCQVTEERNGEYELEMEYPETGALFSSLGISKIILAEPGKNRTTQPFRIYKVSKPLGGIVTVNARHISYQLSYVPVMPFAAVSTASAALNALKSNAAESCPFLFQTDVATNGTFSVSEPQSLRSMLGGQDGSVLDVFGGEYEFNRYNVILHAQRGVNNGVTLRYGKNITDIEQEENIANTTTGICPYWAGSDGDMVTLPEKVVSSDNAENFPFPLTVPLDMSSEFEQKPTVEQLREAAQDYVERNNLGVPSVSISLSFVDLSQTEEYKDIAPMESVELCDTVTVIFDRLGVSAEAKVVKTEHDVLAGRYTNLEIGDLKSTLSSTIAAQGQEIAQKTSSSFLQAAVDRATGWITGTNGGYVVLHRNGNGQPYEMLIMDTPDIETATKVWRWNQGGLGYSSNGYDGPYETAITQDGEIVANFMTVGTLQGVTIIADNGEIAGWNITERALYRDVTVGGTIYRVYIQSPQSDTDWTFSVQQSTNGGQSFSVMFYVRADGYVYANDIHIAGGTINITTAEEDYSAVNINWGDTTATIRGGGVISVENASRGWEAMMALVEAGTNYGTAFRSRKNGETVTEIVAMDTYSRQSLKNGNSEIEMHVSDQSSYVQVENGSGYVRLNGSENPTISMRKGSESATIDFDHFKSASMS